MCRLSLVKLKRISIWCFSFVYKVRARPPVATYRKSVQKWSLGSANDGRVCPFSEGKNKSHQGLSRYAMKSMNYTIGRKNFLARDFSQQFFQCSECRNKSQDGESEVRCGMQNLLHGYFHHKTKFKITKLSPFQDLPGTGALA